MSLIGLGLKMLFMSGKTAGKTLAKIKLNDGELMTTIRGLKAEHGLSEEYIQNLIEKAETKEALAGIKEYLVSSQNTIPYNRSAELLAETLKKSGDLAWMEHLAVLRNDWLKAHHDTDFLSALLEHIHELT